MKRPDDRVQVALRRLLDAIEHALAANRKMEQARCELTREAQRHKKLKVVAADDLNPENR